LASDLDAYAEFAMNVIRRRTGIKELHTMFALKEPKSATGLPLPSG
jgi:Lrp/AsnC family leucine-responsive transcriptional regulator